MAYTSGFVAGCDGTRLFYQTCGQGPDIVACNGIGVSTFFWKYLQKHFQSRYRFTLWDYRGHGRSEPPRDRSQVTIESNAEDLACVAEQLDIRKPILLGHSMGVQVILEYYKRYSEKAAALVPVLGSFGRPLDTFMNSSLSRPVFDRMVALSRRAPRLLEALTRLATNPRYAVPTAGILGLFDRFYGSSDDLAQYLEHIAAIDNCLFMEMALSMADHSAEDVLPRVQVPTLIVAAEHDLFTPVYLSMEMHRRISGSELLLLRGGSHAALIEQPEVIIARLEQFFDKHHLASTTTSVGERQASGAEIVVSA